jgi:hypothetical protein
MFPVYAGTRSSRKAFHLAGKYFAGDEEVETEVRKRMRQQSKDFYAAGFNALVKRWNNCISVYKGEINNLSSFEYHMFYVLYRFVSYLRILPRT